MKRNIALVVMVCLLGMLGCGETENPLSMDMETEGAVGMLGAMKVSEMVAAAPQAPKGTPFVKEVSFYSDMQRSNPLTETVNTGDTIFIKVVFSEEMKLKVADATPKNWRARPILYHRVGGERTRCNIVSFGANGEDFTSGDFKPVGSQKVFYGSYTVKDTDTGRFSFEVGKNSTDLKGNTLNAYYRHKEKLRIRERDTSAKTRRGGEDFTGQVFFPNIAVWSKRIDAKPIAGITVTIVSGPGTGARTVTNKNGRYTFQNIHGNKLHLRVERDGFETKEVIVCSDRGTILADGTLPNYYRDPQRIPGNILIGHAWPDDVRFILEQTKLPPDLMFVQTDLVPGKDVGSKVVRGKNVAGRYSTEGVAILFRHAIKKQKSLPRVVAHEIAHARQHAFGPDDKFGFVYRGGVFAWQDTAEGKAFAKAREKDWEEFGKAEYDAWVGLVDLDENAAETCAYYWSVGKWWKVTDYRELETDAPHRFAWAEEWLNK